MRRACQRPDQPVLPAVRTGMITRHDPSSTRLRTPPNDQIDDVSSAQVPRLTPLASYVTHDAARTPHPRISLRVSGRSERTDFAVDGLKVRARGSREVLRSQSLARHLRTERTERTEMRGNACARVKWGFGGYLYFHALLGISVRSDRSVRDPPLFQYDFNALTVFGFPNVSPFICIVSPFSPFPFFQNTIS